MIRKAKLADNVVPSVDSLRRAQSLGLHINNAVYNRDTFIKHYSLDPKFSMPQENWDFAAHDFYTAGYGSIKSLQWDQLKHLRFRSRAFTGYSLMHMGPIIKSTSSGDEISANFDDTYLTDLPGLDINADRLVARWETLTNDIPTKFIYRAKPMLGEVGWWLYDVLLNSDTVGYQERMTLMYRAGLFDLPDNPRILEIGGGYGALAYAITEAIPDCEYWICDLPEALLFSGIYLSLTKDQDVHLHLDLFVGPSIRPIINLLPNYFAETLEEPFDLVINTLSFAEMSKYQVLKYGALISRLIGKSGKLFEQNHSNSQSNDTAKFWLAQYFTKRTPIDVEFIVRNGVPDIWSN